MQDEATLRHQRNPPSISCRLVLFLSMEHDLAGNLPRAIQGQQSTLNFESASAYLFQGREDA